MGNFLNTVSVLITNFNDARFLSRRLNSISSQTVFPDEAIIIDDGSTDNSQDIIKEWELFYKDKINIITQLHSDNKGSAERFDEGTKASDCNYYHFGASDDYFLPNFIEENKRAIEVQTNPISLYTSMWCSSQNGGLTPQHFPDFIDGYTPANQIMNNIVQYGFWMPGNTALVHKDAYNEVGTIDNDFKWHADLFMVYAVAFRYGVYYIPQTLAIKVNNPDGIANQGYYTDEQSVIKQAMLDRLQLPENEDIRNDLSRFVSRLRG